MPVTITAHAEGATLAVRAQPGAKRNAVLGVQAGALKVAVTAPPEDGRANAALTDLLRDWLGLKRSQVELLSGATNRNKVFLIRGVPPEELTALVTGKMGGAG
ncbi:UPF0235 protein Sinac_5674 OS=Singulisphaera acidiphila (strain ATCC BAA-1392 / DSM 18658 / VKM B-2454 / MOB10) GN=Sinac_5674 PE=3 SV=1: DUF167 [Gemmataceae bacterium]|nr:UPF0235 protein Sinac_5674 OS=Singulisphaera acidiphila (strain ATCC BAA-1392 / DSM 18658 / VKM B-2454 / MOB10) GN=Sinac_5674 PE=3 SV=1: DUF167 [Gemmataceae bacterium]VTU01264.1 UPF0235 protein Sinac_5674 OS=Singulisphaera acidiphila (strain ATCC BAA-1392 / DSM 18658 / VKM B-2454 / MOB10) GN=Sinac_5674 PE=3 SV=1: DUF167 [Gemmataceae bacterium]